MRSFIQHGIIEIDGLMEQKVKDEITNRRKFQDPILF